MPLLRETLAPQTKQVWNGATSEVEEIRKAVPQVRADVWM